MADSNKTPAQFIHQMQEEMQESPAIVLAHMIKVQRETFEVAEQLLRLIAQVADPKIQAAAGSAVVADLLDDLWIFLMKHKVSEVLSSGFAGSEEKAQARREYLMDDVARVLRLIDEAKAEADTCTNPQTFQQSLETNFKAYIKGQRSANLSRAKVGF